MHKYVYTYMHKCGYAYMHKYVHLLQILAAVYISTHMYTLSMSISHVINLVFMNICCILDTCIYTYYRYWQHPGAVYLTCICTSIFSYSADAVCQYSTAVSRPKQKTMHYFFFGGAHQVVRKYILI